MTRFMPDLAAAGRLYVSGVIAASIAVLAALAPPIPQEPGLFTVLLGLATIASARKVRLPLAKTGLTISASFVVFFTAMLLLSMAEAMIIAAASAWVQCAYRPAGEQPLYRTLFSVASVAVAVAAASLTFGLLGGPAALDPAPAVVPPVLAAATVYFLINSLLVGVAISLVSGQSFKVVWGSHMLGSAPAYLLGALGAVAVALIVLQFGALGALALAVPAYASFRAVEAWVRVRLTPGRAHTV